MNPITIVSLGPGAPDLLSLKAIQTLKDARQVLLRTRDHGAVPFLIKEGIVFSTLDDLRDTSEDFAQFNQNAAAAILDLAKKDHLVYAVVDSTIDETVRALRQMEGLELLILPGIPLSAPLLASAQPMQPVLVTTAMDVNITNAQQPLCVVELASAQLAGDVKLKLLDKYGENAIVHFFPPSEEAIRPFIEFELTELDRQPVYDPTCGFIVYPVPLTQRTQYDPEDLLAIMRILRSKDGCPWDREQTHVSLAKYLLEEANEAACALVEQDWDEAAEELGDVFLQLAFHAVVGEEHGTFTWEDMLREVCAKLIRRHPHVFADKHLDSTGEVLEQWDKIKQQEKKETQAGHRMLGVPKGLSPFLRAEKVQKLASKAGFDWDTPLEALEKVHEEANELKKALESGGNAMDELGDLLFSCVNTARLMDASVDQAIHMTTEKFVNRYIWMEKAIKKDEKDWNLLTIKEIGVYWERSKAES